MTTSVSILRSSAILATLAALSYVLSFAKNILIAAYFGAGRETDAYFVSNNLPELVFFVVNSTVYLAFIAVYNAYRSEQGEASAEGLAMVTLGGVVVATLGLTVLILATAPWLVVVMAPGFDREAQALAVTLLRIVSLSMVFLVGWSVMSGLANARGKFAGPAISQSIPNVVIIGAILAFAATAGIRSATAGYVLGYAVAFLGLLLWMVGRGYFLLRWPMNPPWSGLRRMVLLGAPFLVASVLSKLMVVVNRLMASMLPEGSVSVVSYAFVPLNLVHNLFVISLLTVLYANMSRSLSGGETAVSEDLARKGTRAIAFLIIPASVGLLLLSDPIIRVLFHRGAFSEEAVSLTAGTLMLYAPGLFSLALVSLFVRVCFARQEVRWYVYAMGVAFVLNIFLNLLFIPWLGVRGIGLSFTCVSAVSAGLLYWWLKSRGLYGLNRADGRFLAKVIVASVVMAGILALAGVMTTEQAWRQSPVAVLAAGVSLGVVCFWGMSVLLRIEERFAVLQILPWRRMYRQVPS